MKIKLLVFLLLCFAAAAAQTTIPLYPGTIPGAKDRPDQETTTINSDSITIVAKISRPTITVYMPSKKMNTHTAIIIFPGGGYWINALEHEGHAVGRYLSSKGIVAFVVKYRIPDTTFMSNPEIAPLQDAQQAIGWVRSNVKKYKIKTNRVGVLGFSAGGHLAATASTHYMDNLLGYKNVRPDFSVLIYPVISFTDSVGHTGSRDALLGKNASPEKIIAYSNELRVTENTPPAFLAHAKDDWVNYKNSVLYDEALKKFNIPQELLLFEKGGHGFGMINKASDVQWPDEMLKWLGTLRL